MALEGKIEDLAVKDLLQYLHAGRKSGTCLLSRENEKAYIYLHNGNIVHATHPHSTNVGDILIQNNYISSEVLQKALALQKKDQKDKPIGQILVEKKEIRQGQLKEIVLKQIKDVIQYLVDWKKGDFSFENNKMIPVDDINLNPISVLPMSQINTQLLLMGMMQPLEPSKLPNDPLSARVEPKTIPDQIDLARLEDADFFGTRNEIQDVRKAVPPQPSHPAPSPAESAKSAEKEAPSPGVKEGLIAPPAKTEPLMSPNYSREKFESRWRVGKKDLILLLTGDGIFKNLLREALQDQDFSVVTPTTTGQFLVKAETYLARGVIPFFLTDDRLPGAKRSGNDAGISILSEVRKSGWPTPVVVMIETPDTEKTWQLYRAGARAVLPKPVRNDRGKASFPGEVNQFSDVIEAITQQLEKQTTNGRPKNGAYSLVEKKT